VHVRNFHLKYLNTNDSIFLDLAALSLACEQFFETTKKYVMP
jgi:hypothetical protein